MLFEVGLQKFGLSEMRARSHQGPQQAARQPLQPTPFSDGGQNQGPPETAALFRLVSGFVYFSFSLLQGHCNPNSRGLRRNNARPHTDASTQGTLSGVVIPCGMRCPSSAEGAHSSRAPGSDHHLQPTPCEHNGRRGRQCLRCFLAQRPYCRHFQ